MSALHWKLGKKRKTKNHSSPVSYTHLEITEIEVCTDNDFAGRWACEHIRKAYEGSYRIIENLPEIEGADWADMAKMAARTPEKRQNREAR